MKNILSLLFIGALTFSLNAQTVDSDRMHRDLEVAENALSTIISPNKSHYPRIGFGNEEITADYIKDFGVIFQVPNSGHHNVRVFAISGAEVLDSDESEVEVSTADSEKDIFIKNSMMFLADYAGIIGQLDEDDFISIRRGGSDMHMGLMDMEKAYYSAKDSATKRKATAEEKQKLKEKEKIKEKSKAKGIGGVAWAPEAMSSDDSELIIETTMGKINALRKGKISREDFFKSVSVVENIRDYSKDADLETLSAMFQRLYKKDLSDTYYSEIKPKYSKLSNFGVIVKMKFYSSYESDNVYSMPTIDKKGLTLEERNNHVMELLPKFEADFKENLVNYGRTLKNLDSDEILMFEINMTTCNDCNDFPRFMKFSIKKSDLHKFNKGSMSMNEAVKKVNVERISK